MTRVQVLHTVAHNCHGKNKNLTAKTKYLTAKPKTSRQNQNTSRQKQNTSRQKQNTSRQNQSYFAVKYLVLPRGILFLPWGFWFCHNVFVFAVRFLVSPWGFWFRREVFCFCRDVFGLPWQLWATIPYILPTVFFLLLFTTLSYKSPILWVKVTIWLWGIHSSHNHLTLGYPF